MIINYIMTFVGLSLILFMLDIVLIRLDVLIKIIGNLEGTLKEKTNV